MENYGSDFRTKLVRYVTYSITPFILGNSFLPLKAEAQIACDRIKEKIENHEFIQSPKDTIEAKVDTTQAAERKEPIKPYKVPERPLVLAPEEGWTELKPLESKANHGELYIKHTQYPYITAMHTRTLATPLVIGRDTNSSDVLDLSKWEVAVKTGDNYKVINLADRETLRKYGVRAGIEETDASILRRISDYYKKIDPQASKNFRVLAKDISRLSEVSAYFVWANLPNTNKFCQSVPFLVKNPSAESEEKPTAPSAFPPVQLQKPKEMPTQRTSLDQQVELINKEREKDNGLPGWAKFAIGAGVGAGIAFIAYAIADNGDINIEVINQQSQQQNPPDGWGHDRDRPHDGVENP